MRLFYAHTEPKAVKITAPYQTFPTTEFDEVITVQPIRYQSYNGKRTRFKDEDISKLVYSPKNNGHKEITVVFSDTFDAATVTLKVWFKTGFSQLFTLPYITTTTVDKSYASTNEKEIACSRPYSVSNLTLTKTYVDSKFINTTESPNGFKLDLKNLNTSKNSTIEVVGATIDMNSSDYSDLEVISGFNQVNTKFLESNQFVSNTEGLKSSAGYVYIYGQEINLSSSKSDLGGCLDPNADSTTVGATYTNNTCVYATRAPENVEVETTVASKTKDVTVTYLEKALPSASGEIDNITDFSVLSYDDGVTLSGPDTTPTSKVLDIKNDIGYLRVTWTDGGYAAGFNSDLSIGTLDGEIVATDTVNSKTLTIPVVAFRTSTIGCTDSNAINYDADNEGCGPDLPDCCLYCDAIYNVNTTANVQPVNVASSGIDTPITLGFASSAFLIELDEDLIGYLSQIPAGDIEYNIYDVSQVNYLTTVQDFSAQITGPPLLTLNNLAAVDGLDDAFAVALPPVVAGNGIVTGGEYVVETVITKALPAPCSTNGLYIYVTFNIPFNGCTDPNSENYDPNEFNTGAGQCNYAEDATPCTAIYSVEGPTLNADGNYLYTLVIYGQDLDGDSTADTSIEVSLDINFGNGSTAIVPFIQGFPNSPFSYNFVVEPTNTATIILTNLEVDNCQFTITADGPEEVAIQGCTDPLAENYNSEADQDDGSCVYCSDVSVEIARVSNDTGTCGSFNNDGFVDIEVINAPGNYTINLINGNAETVFSETYNVNEDGSVVQITDLPPNAYQAQVIIQLTPTIFCQGPEYNLQFAVTSNELDCGCTDPNAINYEEDAVIDNGSCIYAGCTDILAANYNPNATYDDGSCIYPVPEVDEEYLCIPDTVDGINFDTILSNLKECVSNNGTTLLFKIRGGIKCDTVDLVKLSLASYLLNKIGLECLYNCNYTYYHGDEQFDCEELWNSNGQENWVSGTEYVSGSIVRHLVSGEYQYFFAAGNIAGPAATIQPQVNAKWNLCQNVSLPSGTETYLETFLNFVRKYCTSCVVDTTQVNTPQGNLTQYLDGIDLENGNNLEI